MIDYSDSYSKTYGSLWQYYKDDPNDNIKKSPEKQGDDYTTSCLLDYPYFKENYKLIAIDLSKQQALDADPRAIQQINFTANLDRAGKETMFFIIAEAKENVYEFSQGTLKVLWMQFFWLKKVKQKVLMKSLSIMKLLNNSLKYKYG